MIKMQFLPVANQSALLVVVALTLLIGGQTSCKADSWELPKPIRSTAENYSPETLITAGSFSVEAMLSLKEINGTAASVWVGRDLNFGFDARGGGLFVEGRLVGKTKMLGRVDDHIRANVPFRFFCPER
jgi:hypothetical protein